MCSIFLICLINAALCRKYIVEVEDHNRKPSLDNKEVLGGQAGDLGEVEEAYELVDIFTSSWRRFRESTNLSEMS